MEISTSDVPYLPKEVVSEILSWMPVKSLLQFRTVCKSWQFIISNPQFIKTHSDRIATLKSLSIIVLTMRGETFSPMYFNSLTNCIDLQLPRLFKNIYFISSCNGIVCLGNRYGDVISIWNPATKQSKSLPKSPSCIRRQMLNPFQVTLGFSFDSVSNDYKVLRIVNQYTTPVLAELYSTNADSWKKIHVHTQSREIYSRGTVKGIMYFVSSDKEIVSFDFYNEVFRVVPSPRCLKGERIMNILDFNGAIAVVVVSAGNRYVYDSFSIWEMTDICGEVSWRNQFTCEAALEIDSIFTYLSTGQFVASAGWNRLILYDYKKKETMNFQHSGPGPFRAVINHTESLVSIKGFRTSSVSGLKQQSGMFTLKRNRCRS